MSAQAWQHKVLWNSGIGVIVCECGETFQERNNGAFLASTSAVRLYGQHIAGLEDDA